MGGGASSSKQAPAPGAVEPARAAGAASEGSCTPEPLAISAPPSPTARPGGGIAGPATLPSEEYQPPLLVKTESGRFRRSSLVVETTTAMERLTEDGLDMINQYVLLEELGRGSFATVRRGATEEGEFAVKIVDKKRLRRIRLGRTECALDKVLNEVAVWKLLEHDNVVQLLEVIDDEESDALYLISELVPGGPLRQDAPSVEPMPEQQARRYFGHLLDGLEYLHFQRVCHRDIKPSNLLVSTDDVLKITDFGVSYEFASSTGEDEDGSPGDALKSTSGTAAFMAPEVMQNEEFSGKAADVWSVGATLYMMVQGRPPFVADTVRELCALVQRGDAPLTFDVPVSPQLEALIRRVLVRDPDARPSLEELRADAWMAADPSWQVAAKPHRRINLPGNLRAALTSGRVRRPSVVVADALRVLHTLEDKGRLGARRMSGLLFSPITAAVGAAGRRASRRSPKGSSASPSPSTGSPPGSPSAQAQG